MLLFCLSLLVIVAGSLVLDSGSVRAEGVEKPAPLPTHPDFKVGKLAHGLRYMIREHATPPGWVAIRLLETSGSLNEDDDQRGLAHFFEHLAFNGSEHFPAGTLIPTFENLGVEFGRNLNASTGFDRTLYMVNLPTNDPETVRTGLTWASDVAFRIGLSAEEIEKERGVILEEYRTGLGADERIQKKMWSAMMPGARLPERWPIGVEEVIKGANRERLGRYYDTWYRPNKMTLMVIGDVKAGAILPVINELFDVPSRDGGKNEPDRSAGVTAYYDQKSIVVTDPEFVGCDVDLTYLDEGLPPVTTLEAFRQQQILDMASYIFGRRLDNMIAEGGMPFRSAQAAVAPVFRSFTYSTVSVSCDPDQWQASLEILAEEVKRIFEYGVIDSELERAKKATLAQAKAFAAQEPTFPSQVMASIAISQVNAGDTLMSGEQAAELLEKVMPTISLDEVNAVYAHYFDPSKMAFSLTLPEKEDVEVPSEATLLSVAREALKRDVSPFSEEAGATSLMTEIPEAGRIAEKTTDDELGITTVRFADNVLAHHKFNDFRKNSISVTISIEGGEIEETAETRGITEAAIAAWNQSATHELSSTQITDLMSDKNINISVGGRNRDSVQVTVSGLPDDLESGLQLAYLLLTDPVVEESAFANWKNQMLENLDGRQFNQIEQLRIQLNLARTDDPRFRLITRANVESLSAEKVQDWMRHLIADGPIEVSVVGDMKYDQVMPLMARYVGSVSPRASVGSVVAGLRNVVAKKGPQNRIGYFVSQEDKAFGFVAFRGPNSTDVKEKRLMDVAASIMSTRMNKEIREARGIVYSIGTVSVPADVYPDLGMFYAASMCSSANADQLVNVSQEMYGEFAKEGPSEGEVQTALAQITANLGQAVKTPNFWSGGLSHLAMRGGTLDELRDPVSFFENEVTAEDVQDVFRRYFVPERMITVKVLPKGEDGPAGDAEASEPKG